MGEKKIKPKVLKALLTAPETAVEHLDLVYLDSDKLAIQRLKEKENFNYLLDGKPVLDIDHLKRIESLVIPPAWEAVRISHLPNGHLQAIGKDQRQRKQYRYHPIWTKVRNQTKFYKMGVFGEQLPKIRKKVDNDLDQKGWPKTKVMALIIRLMEETHIRIGSEQYSKRNKTYGLSTLRTRHVQSYQDKLKFEFTGKKGKKHSVTLRNKQLIRLVNKCEEIPGWELFQFFDSDGNKQAVDSGMVNDYLHEISGALFTAKDFRTWAATVIFFDSLMEMGPPVKEQEIQKHILKGFDAAAKALGNTRNVCRKYYVHPLLIASYEENLLKEAFEKVDKIKSEDQFLSPSEIVILELIKSYNPLLILN